MDRGPMYKVDHLLGISLEILKSQHSRMRAHYIAKPDHNKYEVLKNDFIIVCIQGILPAKFLCIVTFPWFPLFFEWSYRPTVDI